jgi:hypothetical protein
MIHVIARNENNNLVFIKGERESFRMRQRARTLSGEKVSPLRFVSYKEALKIVRRKHIYGPVELYTVSKL